MIVKADQIGNTMLLVLEGRLGSFEAGELQAYIDKHLAESAANVIMDFQGLEYISSAGLRILTALRRILAKRHGELVLAALQSYCQDVLDIAGFLDVFPAFASVAEAKAYLAHRARCDFYSRHFDELEKIDIEGGRLTVMPGSEASCAIKVLGDVKDVLYARITEKHVASRRFSETEYSIGLGGMGQESEDYFDIMGEMMTIGGTMVWLPTDGHDTPDFLIPRKDRGQISLKTGFNVALKGHFNEVMILESNDPQGLDIKTIYRILFDLAARRRSDFKGMIGLAMRAQMPAVYGSGVKKSPVANLGPGDGEMIISSRHSPEWFDFDAEPRYQDVTGLICGIGADLTTGLRDYDQDLLNCVFYLNPANTGSNTEMLHNHAVLFEEIPPPAKPVDLDREIGRVVEKGEFVDMRHLLDSSRVSHGVIGVCYIQTVEQEEASGAD